MTTRPRYAALKAYDDCVQAMVEDPALTGDLLLIGVIMARRIHLGPDGPVKVGPTAHSLFGGHRRIAVHRWRTAMVGDIRRYDYGQDPRNREYGRSTTRCGAPLVRREGSCDRGGGRSQLLTDPETGRQFWHSACSRHVTWWRAVLVANQATIAELGRRVPIPAANVGGVLRRHLPSFDWEGYWRSLQPNWVEPPEDEPFVRPDLRVLILDADPHRTPPVRPALTVLPGGAS